VSADRWTRGSASSRFAAPHPQQPIGGLRSDDSIALVVSWTISTKTQAPTTRLRDRWRDDESGRLYVMWRAEDGGMHQPVESTVDDDRAALA
jgi:hypothetical protein